MALTPGTRLGPYEIVAPIGVGGMGEVYRSTDTNLKRAVAIKVLPQSVAEDRERLARFQREAEMLASLTREMAPEDVPGECHFECHRCGKSGKREPTDESGGELSDAITGWVERH